MRRSVLAPLILAAMVAASVAWAAGVTVHVDAATQKRLAVTTAPLISANRATTISGYAKVIDPLPLAMLDSDIMLAANALQASQLVATRAHALNAADATVATKVVEAADAERRANAAKLMQLRRRLGLEWGAGVARLSDAQRTALITSLVNGQTALVRIDTASGVGLPGLRTADIDLGPAGFARATVLGPMRAAEPGLQSPGVLARVDGAKAAGLSVGLIAPVQLSGARGAGGVIIPRTAILRTGGQTWAYVRRGPEDFERRPITGALSESEGLFAPSGFKAGEVVVTSGAAALFAAEAKSED
ncbi:hypothetical protein BH11PSE2_BH11PSE2_11860 [soil metagenome]